MEAVAEKPIELKKISPKEMEERIAKKEKTAAELNNKPAELPADKIVEKLGVDGKPLAEQKPEEKPADKPEPKLEAEGKPITEEPKAPKLRDKVKPFSNKKVTPTPEGEVVIPDTIKSKLSDYEKQIAEKDGILNDSDFKTFLEIKKAGKSVIDIFKESVGNAIDTKKMTDAQAYEYGLKASGVKPSAELDKDSEEPSLEDEMQKFKDMGRIAQKREADAIRGEIEKSQANQTDTFLNKLIAHNEKSEVEINAKRGQEAQKINNLKKDIAEWADAYAQGQEHLGVVGTPQMAESIKNFDLTDLVFPKKEDGSLDSEKVTRLIHYSLFGDMMFENLENQFFSKGFEELKKEVEVTKGATQGLSRAPQASQKTKTEKEMIDEGMSKIKPFDAGHGSVRR